MIGWLGYIQFQLESKSLHGVHSPFVYTLHEKVIRDRTVFKEYHQLNLLKSELRSDKSKISFYDYGALPGEKVTTVHQIAKNSGVSEKYGQLLFRLTRWFQPKHVLELGTSLGIGTSYLTLGCGSDAHIWSLEGGQSLAEKAKLNFKNLGIDHKIQVVTGAIDQNLESVLEQMKVLDFAYLDANHKLNPTLQYFEKCLPYIHENSVLVFDDINWSREMQAAWNIIIKDPRVTVSLDLYRFGVVFFKKSQVKEHFKLRF